MINLVYLVATVIKSSNYFECIFRININYIKATSIFVSTLKISYEMSFSQNNPNSITIFDLDNNKLQNCTVDSIKSWELY